MRAKRGIGVSFDKATLDMIDSLLSQCQYQRSLKEGGDAVCAHLAHVYEQEPESL